MRRIALLVCLLSTYSFGQGGAATGIPTITNTRGEPVPYATVAVCVGYPGAVPSTPCGTSTLATIATDLTLTTSCTNSLTPPGPISGTGCSNPGKSDGLGNIIAFATPGLYWCQYSGGSIIQPLVTPCFFANGTGGGIPFACASAVNGSIVGMTSTVSSSCDPFGVTDFLGHYIIQSLRTIGTFNGSVEFSGGLPDPTSPPDTNSVAILAALTAPTPYYLRLPAAVGTVGNCLTNFNQAAGSNGTIVTLNWGTCGGVLFQTNTVANSSQTLLNLVAGSNITLNNTSGGNVSIASTGGGAEFQTNSVDNANCTAGSCPKLNLVAGTNITLTNTSAGNVTVASTGVTSSITTHFGPQDCTSDQSGNTGYGATNPAPTNIFVASWGFLPGTAGAIYCKVYVPHALAGTPNAKVVLKIYSADGVAGHTANFKTCDVVGTSNYNVAAPTCAANQSYTTTGTAYAVTTNTYNIQSTIAADDILFIEVVSATTGTQPTNNIYVDVWFQVDQTL